MQSLHVYSAFNLIADQGSAKRQPWTPDEATAHFEPFFTFLRAGLDGLKQPPTKRRRGARSGAPTESNPA